MPNESNEQEKVNGGTILFYLVILLCLWPWLIAWNGWVFVCLWTWFVVPVFDLPAINIVQAIGLCLVARVMLGMHWVSRIKVENDDPATRFWSGIVLDAVVPAVILGMGWILTLFL